MPKENGSSPAAVAARGLVGERMAAALACSHQQPVTATMIAAALDGITEQVQMAARRAAKATLQYEARAGEPSARHFFEQMTAARAEMDGWTLAEDVLAALLDRTESHSGLCAALTTIRAGTTEQMADTTALAALAL